MSVSNFGRIGRDANLRHTPSGTAVCNFPVAVEYGRKGDDGRKPTQWYEVTAWGKQAEGLAQYITKGKQIFFAGRDLHIQEFQKNDGTSGFKLCCDLADIKFASDGQPQQQPQQQQNRAPQQQYNQQAQQQAQGAMQPQGQQSAPAAYDDFEDSLPF